MAETNLYEIFERFLRGLERFYRKSGNFTEVQIFFTTPVKFSEDQEKLKKIVKFFRSSGNISGKVVENQNLFRNSLNFGQSQKHFENTRKFSRKFYETFLKSTKFS